MELLGPHLLNFHPPDVRSPQPLAEHVEFGLEVVEREPVADAALILWQQVPGAACQLAALLVPLDVEVVVLQRVVIQPDTDVRMDARALSTDRVRCDAEFRKGRVGRAYADLDVERARPCARVVYLISLLYRPDSAGRSTFGYAFL